MEVTDVRVNLIDGNQAVKGIGSITLDKAFVIKGVRVMEGRDGKLFMALPSRMRKDGSYEDIAFPVKKELYHQMEDALIDKYAERLRKQQVEGLVNSAIEKGRMRYEARIQEQTADFPPPAENQQRKRGR